jgi:glycosyltransferase involved in cell wall biosynthesis
LPKFSIILPVRNGGEFVKESVKSILEQSFTDFNLLVLDNNSTDGTLEWIQSIADNRIMLYPSLKPLSIEENWGRVTSIPKNEFITLIGHDDILSSDYLGTMYELISSYPDASLYQTHFTYIDTKDNKIRSCKPMAEVESAEDFLTKFLLKEIDVMGTGFMMRSKDYDSLGGIPPYPNLLFADFELWINLSKLSYKATSPKECFSFRLHQSTTTVSPDIKIQQALTQFVKFLTQLKADNADMENVIYRHGAGFLLRSARSYSHRMLRSSRKKRQGMSVKHFIGATERMSVELGIQDQYHPKYDRSLRLSQSIDENKILSYLFRQFKKIYHKPLIS